MPDEKNELSSEVLGIGLGLVFVVLLIIGHYYDAQKPPPPPRPPQPPLKLTIGYKFGLNKFQIWVKDLKRETDEVEVKSK